MTDAEYGPAEYVMWMYGEYGMTAEADSSAGDSATRPADLSTVRAVVIDASIMGRGGDLRVSTLRQIAILAKRDGNLEVWVPEPVLWEWCEHATREYAAAADSLRSSRARLERAGVDAPEMLQTSEEVRGQVERAVRAVPGVKIIELDPQEARAALRDQVLAIPPGERVTTTHGSVKTGASDSAWIRAVHRAAENDADRYVILSADSDVAAAFKQWAWTAPLILRSYKALAEALEGAELPTLTEEHVHRIVDRVVQEDWQETLAAYDPIDEGGVVDFALGEGNAHLREDVWISEVTETVAIGDLEVIDRVGTVHGTLFQIGQVEVTGWTHDTVTDRLEPSSSRRVECLMRTRVVLSPDADWPQDLLLTFEGDGVTYLHPLTGEWGEASDAFNELLEALRSLPGCAALEWPPPTGEDTAVVETEVGTRLTLQMDPNAVHREWHATVTHADVTAEVSCEFVESNYLGETWTMTATARSDGEAPHPAGTNPWALTAALIRSFGGAR